MLRESVPTLKRNLIKTFNECFLSKGFQQYVKDFNQQTLTLKWSNGSEIIFMGENYDGDKELNRFRGLEINGAFIDEVNEIQEATFDKIIERSGSWFGSPGCPTKILMSCNPSQNWVKQRFYEPYKLGTLPDGVAYLQAKIWDNPHIPQDYLESLKMLPRYQYEVFVNGDWDIALKTGGEFYKCFELERHVGKCLYKSGIPIHVSWDDNVNPYLPAGIFQIENKPGGGYDVRMIHEIAGISPRNTVKDVCNEIIRKCYEWKHDAGMFIYGDATANKEDTKLEKGFNFYRLILDNLKQYRPTSRVLNSNPSVAMRGNWINTIFENELDRITITIDESCKKTINDFVLTKESADGTKLKEMETDAKTKIRYQKVGHFSDLFDYFLVSAFAGEFQKYQRGNSEISYTFGGNTSKNRY